MLAILSKALPVLVRVTVCAALVVPTVCEPKLNSVDERLTDVGGGVVVTVTLALADFVGSAVLVAVTVSEPAVAGAVYKPLLETMPLIAVQFTAVFVDPVTVAVNCCCCPVCTEAEVGAIETDTVGVTELPK